MDNMSEILLLSNECANQVNFKTNITIVYFMDQSVHKSCEYFPLRSRNKLNILVEESSSSIPGLIYTHLT